MSVALTAPLLGERHHSVVTVGTTAVQLAPQRMNRKALLIANLGTAQVFLGPSTVAASGPNAGIPLAAGALLVDSYSSDPWFAITASGSVPVHACEII